MKERYVHVLTVFLQYYMYNSWENLLNKLDSHDLFKSHFVKRQNKVCYQWVEFSLNILKSVLMLYMEKSSFTTVSNNIITILFAFCQKQCFRGFQVNSIFDLPTFVCDDFKYVLNSGIHTVHVSF